MRPRARGRAAPRCASPTSRTGARASRRVPGAGLRRVARTPTPSSTRATYRFALPVAGHARLGLRLRHGGRAAARCSSRRRCWAATIRARYRSERIHATAADGTRVPISLVYRAGHAARRLEPAAAHRLRRLRLSRTRSTFSSNRLSLLDRGVVFAIAHIRGGGELGKRWHDDGPHAEQAEHVHRLHRRRRVPDRASGYTAADRLVIEGGSAGGLLMGAVLNLRPDLFKAVVLPGAVRGRDQHHARRVAAAHRRASSRSGAIPKIREQYEYMKSLLPLHQPRPRGRTRRMLVQDLAQRQPGDVLGAGQVRGAGCARSKTDANPLLFKINMDGRPRRRLRPLRLPARDRLRLRVHPHPPLRVSHTLSPEGGEGRVRGELRRRT